MKLNIKVFFSVVMILTLSLLAFSGCADLAEGSGELKELTVGLLDALDAGDVDKAYSYLAPEACTKENFKSFAAEVADIFEGDGYELKQTYIGINTKNGVTVKVAEFMLITERGEFHLAVNTHSECAGGLSSFHITPMEELQTKSGVATTVFGIISVLEIAFIIVMLVDCCRHKMKAKVLWILMIILLSFSIIIESGSGFKLNFNFSSLLGFTTFTLYGSGAYVLRLMIPVGALIYLFSRKKLFTKAAVAEASSDIPEESVDTTEKSSDTEVTETAEESDNETKSE